MRFKYDIIQLIELVEQRPCLWDKSLESYKGRFERKEAWEEIFQQMDERYNCMKPEEKRLMGEHILNKWTNVRDTFMKTLKTKMGKPRKRYILHEHLKFLTKNIPDEELPIEYVPDIPHLKQEKESQKISRKKLKKPNSSSDDDSNSSSYIPKKKSKIRPKDTSSDTQGTREYDVNFKSEVTDIDFIEVDASQANDHRLMNEDEAFFASLLPTVVKYSEDERLEFRLEVLGVMKRVKDKRNWSVDDNV